MLPLALKQAVVCSLLKKPSLNPSILDNYQPVSNLPFQGKVVKQVVVSQLQRALDEANYLNSFHSGFSTGFGMETALVILVDDLC